jgi:Retinal pigment epithelial membrane protein
MLHTYVLCVCANSGTKWFTLPAPVVCFHALNAWESAHDDTTGAATEIVVVMCQFTEFDLAMVSLLRVYTCIAGITFTMVFL